MRSQAGPPISPHRAASVPPGEVERVRRLYLAALRRRLREGTYLTPLRIRLAMERMLGDL